MTEAPSQDKKSLPDPPSDEMVCYCFEVTEREIEAAIRIKGLKSVEDINQVTQAGCGCHTCWPDLETILRRCERGEYKFPLRAEDHQRLAGEAGPSQQPIVS